MPCSSTGSSIAECRRACFDRYIRMATLDCVKQVHMISFFEQKRVGPLLPPAQPPIGP